MSANPLQVLPITLPPDLAAKCHFEDGVLYVSADAMLDTKVIDLEMRLVRMGALRRKQQTSLADIADRKSPHKAQERRIAAGQELRTALAFLDQGVKMKASDLHFMFRGPIMEVKFRVDGFLDNYAELPAEEGLRIISALYVESDVKNKGSFSFNSPIAARLSKGLSPGLYAVRFASMKTDAGGVVVLRLLYNAVASRVHQGKIELDTLGFSAQQARILWEMAAQPNGLIVIDGPTGSGKSTTLKYVLQWVHEHYPQFNILTVEDPPEYPITGAQQIPVLVQDSDVEDLGARARAYGNVINTTLRLDPDILMVGEIRDGTSALSALRAAITGHRLWTTVHANDAWEAVNRILDLLREAGMVDPMPVLANTQNLTGLIAQRLVPTLCPHCKIKLSECKVVESGKQPGTILQHTLDELMQALPDFDAETIYLRGRGCKHCVPAAENEEQMLRDSRHGILGRTVVAEIVRPDQTLLDIAREKGIPEARRYWLKYRDGRVIADHALEKVVAGLIDPQVARDFVGPLITARQIIGNLESDQVGK